MKTSDSQREAKRRKLAPEEVFEDLPRETVEQITSIIDDPNYMSGTDVSTIILIVSIFTLVVQAGIFGKFGGHRRSPQKRGKKWHNSTAPNWKQFNPARVEASHVVANRTEERVFPPVAQNARGVHHFAAL